MLNKFRYSCGQFSVELAQIFFSGEDVESFLQSQSTFDTSALKDKTFHLTSFLDPQGRVKSYGFLCRDEVGFSFLVPPMIEKQTIERLNQFLISEDVIIGAPERREVVFLLGPKSPEFQCPDAYRGILFDEIAFIQKKSHPKVELLNETQRELWRGLTGWPSFDGSDYSCEILNNLRLFDLGLSLNKGCYPGQETVSKIATRRGAAYSPVLLKITKEAQPGDVLSFGKKIGKVLSCHTWEENFYLSANLLRDFRVENMLLEFSLNGQDYQGQVKYFPLLSGDSLSKAKELFYEGTEFFKLDDFSKAEEKFRQAIELAPEFSDAYESLGVMLGRLERFHEAIELMEELSRRDPKSVMAHTNMSLYLMRLGKIEEAEAQKSLATVKSFQSFGDEAREKELREEIRKKQVEEWEQRESMFLQVLEIDPDDTLANFGIGSIAVEKQEWARAREHLEQVLRQDPKYSVAYLYLGRALKGLGFLDEAKTIWQDGIKVAAAKGDLMPANQMQQELNF